MKALRIVVTTLMILFMMLVTQFAVKNIKNKTTFIGFCLIDALQLMALIVMWGITA